VSIFLHSIAGGLVWALLPFGVEVVAQTRTQKPPPVLTIDSLAGRDTFNAYCAPCHGRTGAGDGPVASVLRAVPSDLRALSSSRGYYPREEIVAFVTGAGRPIAAHGTSDMPIWGTVFRSLDPSDARVTIRLRNVVDYVESLQQPIDGHVR
jgi:mono/diheme cytochrome c family protein